ncbi:hypothetical protein [Mycolicibacterium sp. P1-5]|uniref:hypothetical protein n=1 Tax=Mycolicibacterium sp. P1-5 TaxID=2024617 RepID=UPI0011EDD5E8|nr:hypothetical protein [Mycolicibacterium sp. P1-5]KAA0109238.1 hypothetical protein CIW47_11760 [Mycolicibacterium sp. P1-5]
MFDNWRIRRHGQRCQATVVHAQQAAKVATNDYRKYQFVVDIHPPGGDPVRIEITDTFTIGGLKPAAGDVVNVRWDPTAKRAVFDLNGDPRYDIKALRAQQESQRRHVLDQPPEQT